MASALALDSTNIASATMHTNLNKIVIIIIINNNLNSIALASSFMAINFSIIIKTAKLFLIIVIPFQIIIFIFLCLIIFIILTNFLLSLIRAFL